MPILKSPKWNIAMSKIWYDIQASHVQFTGEKKHLKNEQELKFIFQSMALLNNLQYQYCPKIEDSPLNLYNLKTRKKPIINIIVRIELLINESTKRSQP